MLPCPVPNCGYKNEVDATVCTNCGEDLSSFSNLYFLPSFHFNKGLQAAQNINFDEAIKELQIATTLDKGDVDSLILLGKVYAQKGDYENAINCWQNVLEIRPSNEDAQKAIEKAAKLLGEEPIPPDKIYSFLYSFFDRIETQIKFIHQSINEHKEQSNKNLKWIKIISVSLVTLVISFLVSIFFIQ